MSNVIASEEQAISLGERLTGSTVGEGFTVFSYFNGRYGLTLFGVDLPEKRVFFHQPSAAEPCN